MAGSEKQTKLKKRAYGENKLTDKERAFCYAYVKDYNVAGAARVAGYSEKTAKQYLDQDGVVTSQEIEFKLVPKFPAIALALKRQEDVKEYTNSINWDDMYEQDSSNEDRDSIEQTINKELLVRSKQVKQVASKTV